MNELNLTGRKTKGAGGRLRIGDDWNAITIIALSQNNPLKAIAEFVENSIDANAKNVTIIRGRERGEHYLKIIDDGDGIPCTEEGIPDFKYVATHICDSLKRRLKENGAKNIQGEFGIGLLSFWTVGHKLTVVSSGKNGRTYQMFMEKGRPGYDISPRPHLIPMKGTQLTITPLLEGIRQLNGEKIHHYLSSELRDRIRNSHARIKIIDRTSRVTHDVEPRMYSGQLLHNLPQITAVFGDIYAEIYLNGKSAENKISLFKSGTRVLPDVCVLDEFIGNPWTGGYFQGIIDAPFLHLTPGTRDGIIRDERFAAFCDAILPLKEYLSSIAAEQEKTEDERASKNILKSIQKALKDAILALPREEYDWFNIHGATKAGAPTNRPDENSEADGIETDQPLEIDEKSQKQFFEFAGPLSCARIQPASTIVQAGMSKTLRAVALDRNKRQVEGNLSYTWSIVDGKGALDKNDSEIVVFQSPQEPGLCRLKVTVTQNNTTCEAQAVVTIVDTLIKTQQSNAETALKGLPGYTLESEPGQSWRSKYDGKNNIIIVNSGHRDFLYCNAEKGKKLRYLCRLFAKELIMHNFTGSPAGQMLERMVELSIYTEENLK